MRLFLIPIVISIIFFGILGHHVYKSNTPKVGQVWIRSIETTSWKPNHVDTIVILGIDEELDNVKFTHLHVFDEWTCSMHTVRHYGTFLK